MYNDRKQISGCLGDRAVEEQQEGEMTKGPGEILVDGVKNTFIILILMMASQVYTFV